MFDRSDTDAQIRPGKTIPQADFLLMSRASLSNGHRRATHMHLLNHLAVSMGPDMHAAEFLYNGWTLIPLAPGTTGSYASMLIVADPFGQKRALNRLGDFPTADAACSFALACGKAIADGKDHRRLFHSDGRPKQLFTVAIAATRTR